MSHERQTATSGGRLGGICSILIGVLDVLLVIYVVAIPAGQRYDPGQFLVNYAQNPVPMNVAWIVMAVTSILAVVPSVSALVRSESQELVRAASILGIVGFAVSAVSFLTLLGSTPGLAQAYMAGDTTTKEAIAAVGLPQLDPLNVLVLGGVGVWHLAVNVLALRDGELPKLHALIGVMLAIGLWLAVLAAIIQSERLDQIAAAAGALLAPAWYIWMGIRLIRTSS